MTEHLNGLNKRKLLSSFVAAVLAIGLMVPVAAAYATKLIFERGRSSSCT